MSSLFKFRTEQKEDPKAAAKAPASARSKSPLGKAAPAAVNSPAQEETQKVTAWQNEMDSLEKTQMQIQADQMNLLHSQIHILTRELGDLQKGHLELHKKFDDMVADVAQASEEAHAALRLELAEHGNNAAEMEAAWKEAHGALKDSLDDGLKAHAQAHADALDSHRDAHTSLMEAMKQEMKGNLDSQGEIVRSLSAQLDSQKDMTDFEKIEGGLTNNLEQTHEMLQRQLDILKGGGSCNMRTALTIVTQQVDNINVALATEGGQRKDVEDKLDDLFNGLREVMSVSFEDDDDVAPEPPKPKAKPASTFSATKVGAKTTPPAAAPSPAPSKFSFGRK